jgi:16S rRNA processing protein RimM
VPAARILLGVIGRPHGVRGLVRVVSYTDPPAALASYGVLETEDGRRFALRWQADGVAEVAEVTAGVPRPVADRNAAERLTNLRLFVPRERLPAPADDEYYLADLIGLQAVQADGAALGQVVAVHDYGAGASLEIARSDAGPPTGPPIGAPIGASPGPLVVPFTRAAVPEVDLRAGRVVVVVPDAVDARQEAGSLAAADAASPPPAFRHGKGARVSGGRGA